MAITLPTPLRVAAGIVASGIDLVRSLPEEIPALPVTLVGKAMQLSMKVQQEIADLATKGDELLSGVLGGPQENPPWAQFDDEPPPTTAVAAGSGPKVPAGQAMPGGAGSARAGAARAGTAAARAAAARVAEGGKAPVVTPLGRSTRLAPPGADAPAGEAMDGDSKPGAAKPKDDKTKQAKEAEQQQDKPHDDRDDVPDASRPKTPGLVHSPAAGSDASAPAQAAADDGATTEPEPGAPSPSDSEPEPGAPSPSDSDPDDGPASPDAATADTGSADGQSSTSPEPAEDPDDGPAALPDYDRMTLAQVRGYLRSLSAQEVQSLLDHEQSGDSRAPFLTLLSNRLVTLEHQES